MRNKIIDYLLTNTKLPMQIVNSPSQGVTDLSLLFLKPNFC